MKTIRAVFENGQFRPLDPVELPEQCMVEFEPKPISETTPTKRKSPAKDAIYAILSQRSKAEKRMWPPVMMNINPDAVFLDTVGLLAIWDRTDQWHPNASIAFKQLQADDSDLATTTFILAECGNAAARRPYRLAVDQLREQLEADGALIIPTEDDWKQAWLAYRRGEARNAGLVDQLSIAVMQRLRLRRAFTNDGHFRAAGFLTLF